VQACRIKIQFTENVIFEKVIPSQKISTISIDLCQIYNVVRNSNANPNRGNFVVFCDKRKVEKEFFKALNFILIYDL